ncbi:MAG: Oligopeptide ABC transporter, periplasmic oligopeptide-binding protein OppA [uncultured Thermomicrobiales bacterium]|uniref:Oligopeptide ABC transporter, periplasmic oligopeptide-binding protein OppA n=1 Tax=uncultured Thermomicrobiales bacterium TaxID=1645740 RepID=A0A6J4VAN0_9BACT|nr:MAG: Oligopeptide ABC transporter, periplasmic oligopeptide-binding protein OppA [uncultured Thermomicrobiales bacterium]
MNDGRWRRDELAALTLGITEGRIDRRAFTRRALALGLSLPAIGAILTTYGAGAAVRAQEPTAPANPITVTVGGTPIAVAAQDIDGATPGGVFRYARAEDSNNLDPVTNDGNVNIWIFMNVYDQLVRVGSDGASLVPGLAESWEVSPDGVTYTFKLRPGVLFSDGTPLKASDVLYSFVRAANDPAETWTFTLTALQRDAAGQVQGITTPDDTTVVIQLAQPWAPFLSDVAMFNLSIVSEAFARGNEARLTQECMGTGPFVMAEWRKGEVIRLTKNPNYWEEGLPYLDEVQVFVVPDDNNRILQLQGGEIDGTYDVPASRVPELRQDPNLKVIEFPSTFSQYVTLNHRNPPLDDVNARLALQYATDKQTLIEVVLFGVGVEATSFMPKGALYWNDTLPGFPYDVERAKTLLAQSKTPDGFTLEIQTSAGSAEEEQLATVLKDLWTQIGVDLQISPLERSVVLDNYRSNAFQAQITGWTNDIIDPDELVAYAVLPESSEAYHTGWANPEAQDLARRGAAELDPAKRKEIYFRIQEIFNEDAVMLLLYHTPYVDVTTTRVRNFGHPPTGQWEWKQTWLEQ